MQIGQMSTLTRHYLLIVSQYQLYAIPYYLIGYLFIPEQCGYIIQLMYRVGSTQQ